MAYPKRIGVLTGGGDCPGLNAVLRAIVKTAHNDYKMEVVGFEDGFKGLVENRYQMLTPETVSGILPKGGTILGTTNRDDPFSYLVKQEGKAVRVDMSQQAIDNLNLLRIEALIIIGGDGTLSIAKRFADMGLSVIGVPKTIDNDLPGTEVTFGFHTAVATATAAIDKLHTTAESHHRVMVLEVMGRYAGWIALYAGLAGGADVILIPEIPYDIQKVVAKIEERCQKNKKFSIVVVAEGAYPIGGSMVVKKTVSESPEPIRLGGIGNVVGEELENLTGMETRVTVLGHLQRGGSPTSYDRILATRYGVKAVHSVVVGSFGTMVAYRPPDMVNVDLREATKLIKKVDLDGELVKAARSLGICLGD